jgi:TonB family protein
MRLDTTVVMLSVALTGQLPDSIPAAEASKFVGKKQTVCGPVAGLRHDGVGDKAGLLLDLVRRHPDQALTVAVTQKVVDRFANLEARASLIDVCVTGRIEQKTGLTVRVDDMKNLRGFFRPGVKGPKQDLTSITRPRVLADVKPKYTREAMQAKIQGVVEVAATIRADGSVADLRILKSLDALLGLDDQALIAASGWRFEPARKEGQAVPFDIVIQLEFRLH